MLRIPPGSPVDVMMTPLEFSIFCIDSPGNPRFSQILAYPTKSSTGGYDFSLEKHTSLYFKE